MKPRIYIDTSVVGGCLDEKFSKWSKALFEEFNQGIKIAVVSDLTLRELEEAPKEVGEILLRLSSKNKEHILLDEEALSLAESYILEEVVNRKHIVDAQHIALATVDQVSALVSWNFKQIVNLEKIHQFNAVNLKRGYQMLEIRSPMEVLHG